MVVAIGAIIHFIMLFLYFLVINLLFIYYFWIKWFYLYMKSGREKYLEYARLIFQNARNSVSENKSFSLVSFINDHKRFACDGNHDSVSGVAERF